MKCYANNKNHEPCPSDGKQMAAVLPLGTSFLYLCKEHQGIGTGMGYILTER